MRRSCRCCPWRTECARGASFSWSGPVSISDRNFGIDDCVHCPMCSGQTYLSRRMPHPERGEGYELQIFSCRECKNSTVRTVDKEGRAYAWPAIDTAPSQDLRPKQSPPKATPHLGVDDFPRAAHLFRRVANAFSPAVRYFGRTVLDWLLTSAEPVPALWEMRNEHIDAMAPRSKSTIPALAIHMMRSRFFRRLGHMVLSSISSALVGAGRKRDVQASASSCIYREPTGRG